MSFFLHLEDWRGWHPKETVAICDPSHRISAQPGKNLPAMLRRRLDDAGRATCEILSALAPEAGLPLIHASRHGDTTHTLGMLEALESGEPISPTRFSMSVHNAVLGVHSISCAHHRPLQALGACGDEFDAVLLEAQGYLLEGHRAVVAVFSEGSLPSAYQGHTEHPGTACAVGMRLTLDRGRRLMASDPIRSARPTPIEVMAWLSGNTPFLAGRQRWQMEAG
ncbi:beta-ketoacyl synthase chain length factor [Billgrantia tianxiuensis]|uniref:beta-ketoacyl synthase chain length factor n=1 Tax=Billgrantia tianxiuensis TaxID=2497861 RepID=UPI0024143ACF|nr:beta-ketoacyl synthase chain length factor [Halomonas tianxiuensis]